MKREYLGDGLYVEYDGYHIWLAASNGIEDTNRVALEPRVLDLFLDYLVKNEHIKSFER